MERSSGGFSSARRFSSEIGQWTAARISGSNSSSCSGGRASRMIILSAMIAERRRSVVEPGDMPQASVVIYRESRGVVHVALPRTALGDILDLVEDASSQWNGRSTSCPGSLSGLKEPRRCLVTVPGSNPHSVMAAEAEGDLGQDHRSVTQSTAKRGTKHRICSASGRAATSSSTASTCSPVLVPMMSPGTEVHRLQSRSRPRPTATTSISRTSWGSAIGGIPRMSRPSVTASAATRAVRRPCRRCRTRGRGVSPRWRSGGGRGPAPEGRATYRGVPTVAARRWNSSDAPLNRKSTVWVSAIAIRSR
jgi:hypothetical protein